MKKLDYFNQCDRWRMTYKNGEENWQAMIANKEPISLSSFLKVVNIEQLLWDETVEDFVSDDPEHGFYSSKINNERVVFLQTAGFEFIFTEDGLEPGINLSNESNYEFNIE